MSGDMDGVPFSRGWMIKKVGAAIEVDSCQLARRTDVSENDLAEVDSATHVKGSKPALLPLLIQAAQAFPHSQTRLDGECRVLRRPATVQMSPDREDGVANEFVH